MIECYHCDRKVKSMGALKVLFVSVCLLFSSCAWSRTDVFIQGQFMIPGVNAYVYTQPQYHYNYPRYPQQHNYDLNVHLHYYGNKLPPVPYRTIICQPFPIYNREGYIVYYQERCH